MTNAVRAGLFFELKPRTDDSVLLLHINGQQTMRANRDVA